MKGALTKMNDTLKVIANRYSCRDYQDKMIPNDILRAIAEAAIQAPSAVNRQPWRVIVVKNKELIRDMEAEAMSNLSSMEDKSTYNRIMERGGKLFYNAPCMIIVAIDQSLYESAQIDCGILCENIALAATSLEVSNVICGLTRLVFSSNRAEEFNKQLQFPDGFVFGCSVLLGYANTVKPPHDPDKDKIIFIE